MTDWRDMATAPKDGARFLAMVDGDIRIVAWGKTSHVPLYGFCVADQGAEDFDICQPTHWMPLPPPPEARRTETIDRAAIRHDGVTYSVPRPGRHNDVVTLMARRPDHRMSHCSPSKQGFTTSTGRFVCREEAMRIAQAAGQLIATPHISGKLFSEDLF
jgi:hypothetical protein